MGRHDNVKFTLLSVRVFHFKALLFADAPSGQIGEAHLQKCTKTANTHSHALMGPDHSQTPLNAITQKLSFFKNMIHNDTKIRYSATWNYV